MGTEREKGVRPSLLSVSTLLNAGVSDALTPVSWGVFARLPVFSFLLQPLAVLVQGPCPWAVLCYHGCCVESRPRSQVHRQEGQLDTTYP